MYLLLISFGLCVTYVLLYFLFPFFFKGKTVRLTRQSLYSIIYIILLSLLIFVVSLSVTNLELGNRVLHTFGGGFLSFFTCFLVVRDSKLPINKFQFFILSFLVAIALGVANEILEFFFQQYFHIIFAATVNDTWLDLISNTVGALIAGACFTPLIKK